MVVARVNSGSNGNSAYISSVGGYNFAMAPSCTPVVYMFPDSGATNVSSLGERPVPKGSI